MKDKSEAEKDLDAYWKALVYGDTDACVAIEKKHDLYGYNPEYVTAALDALIAREAVSDD